MAALTRCVRPPGPCLPSKLRLLVLADRWPGLSLSGFIARHILHPAFRHEAPASRKIAVQPLCLGLIANRLASGHDQRLHSRRDLATAENSRGVRRSSIRPLVQEPMKTTSTGMSVTCVPGTSPM